MVWSQTSVSSSLPPIYRRASLTSRPAPPPLMTSKPLPKRLPLSVLLAPLLFASFALAMSQAPCPSCGMTDPRQLRGGVLGVK